MKKVLMLVAVLFLGVTLSACQKEDKVIIEFGGSTSVEDAIEVAANAFKSEVPSFDYNLNQTGSSDGYKRTLGGEKDNNPAHIGFASREFKTTEEVTTGMLNGTFAKDAIAVVVHKDKALVNITDEQIKKIYTGEIIDWSEIDASLSGDINVYSRDAASGTRGAFQELVGFESSELVSTAIITSGNGDQATKVGNDVDGIGYVSLSTNFAANNIKALTYNDIEATVENTIAGTYILARPFNFVTRAENDFLSDDDRDMVKAFIAYLGTKDAIALMKAEGVIIDDTNAPTWSEIKDDYPIIKK